MKQKKTTALWERFEHLVTKISSDLSPSASVKHNIQLPGKNGRMRQIDVLITQEVNLCTIMIIVECKRRKRPVGISQVDAFIQKLRDVQAHLGIIVSYSGFDKGARANANEYGIKLFSLRDAEQIDWQTLFNHLSNFDFIETILYEIEAVIKLKGHPQTQQCPLEAHLYDEAGQVVWSVEGVFKTIVDKDENRLIRDIALVRPDNEPALFYDPNQTNEIELLIFRWKTRITVFPLSVEVEQGIVYEDTLQGTMAYKEMITKDVLFKDVLGQSGKELSDDEYLMLCSKNSTVMSVQIENLNQTFSFRITEKPIELYKEDTKPYPLLSSEKTHVFVEPIIGSFEVDEGDSINNSTQQ
jgi:hypothetical protein